MFRAALGEEVNPSYQEGSTASHSSTPFNMMPMPPQTHQAPDATNGHTGMTGPTPFENLSSSHILPPQTQERPLGGETYMFGSDSNMYVRDYDPESV